MLVHVMDIVTYAVMDIDYLDIKKVENIMEMEITLRVKDMQVVRKHVQREVIQEHIQ